MNKLSETFEAALKGLHTNFVESWALKFLHWLRKTRTKIFSSELSCLLCGKRSVQTVCKEGWAMLEWLWGEIKQGHIFPSLWPQAGGRRAPLALNPLWLSWQHASCLHSEAWGNLWPAGLRNHTREFCCLNFHSLCWQSACSHPAPCGIFAAPLLHLCLASVPLFSIPHPSPSLFLSCLSLSSPFPTLKSPASIWHWYSLCCNDLFCSCCESYLPTPIPILGTDFKDRDCFLVSVHPLVCWGPWLILRHCRNKCA